MPGNSVSQIRIKQFRNEQRVCYAVFDFSTREAIVVDPWGDPLLDPEIRVYFMENGLRLGRVVQTSSLSAGDEIRVGAFRFQTHQRSFSGEGILFSGETLFITRPETIPEELRLLPPETLILPSHESGGLLFSTLGIELGVGAEPGKDRRTEDTGHYASIQVEKYAAKLRKPDPRALYLDVREPDEFAAEHIPGTRNLPLSEVGKYLAELRRASAVYISCLSGKRSPVVARTLSYVGIENPIAVSGGLKAWKSMGLPLQEKS